jgi:selenocysteine-specific translation elongation factor
MLQPLLVVLNKADILKLDELIPEKRAQLAPIESEDIPVMEMSTVTGQGIMEVKQEVGPSLHLLVSKSLCSHNFLLLDNVTSTYAIVWPHCILHVLSS